MLESAQCFYPQRSFLSELQLPQRIQRSVPLRRHTQVTCELPTDICGDSCEDGSEPEQRHVLESIAVEIPSPGNPPGHDGDQQRDGKRDQPEARLLPLELEFARKGRDL